MMLLAVPGRHGKLAKLEMSLVIVGSGLTERPLSRTMSPMNAKVGGPSFLNDMLKVVGRWMADQELDGKLRESAATIESLEFTTRGEELRNLTAAIADTQMCDRVLERCPAGA